MTGWVTRGCIGDIAGDTVVRWVTVYHAVAIGVTLMSDRVSDGIYSRVCATVGNTKHVSGWVLRWVGDMVNVWVTWWSTRWVTE